MRITNGEFRQITPKFDPCKCRDPIQARLVKTHQCTCSCDLCCANDNACVRDFLIGPGSIENILTCCIALRSLQQKNWSSVMFCSPKMRESKELVFSDGWLESKKLENH